MVGKLRDTWRSLSVTERTLLYIAFIMTLAILVWAVERRVVI